ncbi:pentatricopeptide repeat-containing protein At3g49740 [Olea europaea var. sylvestris]|uniref:pentatricopeptide repeat-containing protein At3g49740 n=1 Tax=Olea europaea var. sylvestris TaxID=158386 RepID=UPI000C1D26BC|nr:pentatricopeptide repeat-containing protein At3g49740 [Olea europaea var. sylvestris]
MKLQQIRSTFTKSLLKLNCLLKDLNHSQKYWDALHLFQQIHSTYHLEPDHYTLSTALAACSNLRDVYVGSQIHGHAIKSGFNEFPHVSNTLLSLYAKSWDIALVKMVFDEIQRPDIYSWTTLLSACMKLGESEYAFWMFDRSPQENVAIWNAIITGFAENGLDEVVFNLFQKMHVLGVKHDNYTFASVLSLCSLEMLDSGRQVHSLIVKTGFLVRSSVINALLTMYFNCRSITDAYGVFEETRGGLGDEITYNAMMAGLSSMERGDDVLLIFKDMQNSGWRPTELTFVSVISVCLLSRVATQVHGQAIKMGFEDFTSVSNAAITMYSSCGDLNAARMVFMRIKEKDIVSWNAIITSYAQESLSEDAILAYLQMQRDDIEPDEFTIGSLLASSKLLVVVEMIQASVIKKALNLKIEVSNALLSAFSNLGELNQANKLFHEMSQRNLISWNTLISGFQLNGLPVCGLQQFYELLLSGLRPNVYTLCHALSICASISDLQHGKQLHGYILTSGYFSQISLGNALVTLYAKCGALSWSLKVFQTMIEKDIISWNSIISAHAQHGRGKEAIECFEAMQDSGGIIPDKATFTAVLSACSHSGLVADGIRIFSSMVRTYGLEPEVHHFSCVIDLLSRAGFLDISERLINIKDINIDPSVWWTLFSSCVAHGNLELGSIAARFLLNTEHNEPAVYVLLSNLYANAEKWEESAAVRELMRRYGVV